MSETKEINAGAVYTPPALAELLGANVEAILRDVRAGKLRSSRRCGKRFILGAWVVQWLSEGEQARRGRPARAGFDVQGGSDARL